MAFQLSKGGKTLPRDNTLGISTKTKRELLHGKEKSYEVKDDAEMSLWIKKQLNESDLPLTEKMDSNDFYIDDITGNPNIVKFAAFDVNFTGIEELLDALLDIIEKNDAIDMFWTMGYFSSNSVRFNIALIDDAKCGISPIKGLTPEIEVAIKSSKIFTAVNSVITAVKAVKNLVRIEDSED